MVPQTGLAVEVRLRELAIAVRILGFVLVDEPTCLLDQVDGALFASDLAMLGCQHRHLVGVLVLTTVVVNHGFHRLLIVLAAVIAVYRVALNVDHTWALAEFPADLEPLLNLIFIKAGRSVVWLHLREAATLGAGLRYCAVSVLVLLVNQFDLWLVVFVGVRGNFRYLVY